MMNFDDRPSRRDFALGATAIGAIAGVAALLLAFGKLQPLLERRFPVIVETNGAQGVRPGSLVTLNGVTVGAVRDVAVDPAWHPPVHITIELRPDARVPADADIRLSESLVGGSAEVAFRVRADADAGAVLLAATPVDELEHTVEATLPSTEQQRLLGIAALEPCLALYRRSWSRGKVATVVTLTYPASRYALYSRHRTSARGTFSQ